jgi:hypothetical protein
MRFTSLRVIYILGGMAVKLRVVTPDGAGKRTADGLTNGEQ